MSVQIQNRHVGDTEVAIAATLKRPDGTVVDLTDLDVYFKMVKSEDGSTVVTLTTDNVVVDSEVGGQVHYEPQAADVATAGTYYAYFLTKDAGSNYDTFPAVQGELRIIIHED